MSDWKRVWCSFHAFMLAFSAHILALQLSWQGANRGKSVAHNTAHPARPNAGQTEQETEMEAIPPSCSWTAWCSHAQPLCRVGSETSLVVSHRCWERNKEQLCTSSPGTLVSLLYTMFLIAQCFSLQDCPVSVSMAALQGGTVPSPMKREPLWFWKKDNKSNHSCVSTIISTLVLPFTAPLLRLPVWALNCAAIFFRMTC